MSAPTRHRLLVVDDEPDLRTLYELTLLREGYEVASAADLAQARESLAQQRELVERAQVGLVVHHEDAAGRSLAHV